MADEKGEVAQVPQEKFIEMIHAQNEQCAMAVEQRPRNDQALAVWGAGLLQLAMMEDEVPKKKELLRDCREKLNKAIKVNPDAASPDGQLAIFQLVNAFCNAPAPSQISSKPQWACSVHRSVKCVLADIFARGADMTFIFEEDDAVAESLLEKCKTNLKKGLKKDPKQTELLQQMKGAWEQRREILDASKRFAGKSKEEQAAEYVKMVEEQVQKAEEKSNELGGQDAAALKALGVALVDLSLLKEQTQDLPGARDCVHKAVETLKKSVELSDEKEAKTMLALALNAKAMGEDSAETACDLMKEARLHFYLAIEAESDTTTARQMLLQLREMYKTQDHWCEYHKEGTEQMQALKEETPEWLAELPESGQEHLPAPGEVVQVPLDGGDTKSKDKRPKKDKREKEFERVKLAAMAAISEEAEVEVDEGAAGAECADRVGVQQDSLKATSQARAQALPLSEEEEPEGDQREEGSGDEAGSAAKKKRKKKKKKKSAEAAHVASDAPEVAAGDEGPMVGQEQAPPGPAVAALPPSRHLGAAGGAWAPQQDGGLGMLALGVAAVVAVGLGLWLSRRRAA